LIPVARKRVQHVRVIVIRQEQRPPLGRDPTREAGTERDPHPLLDLLLDPNRRPGDQLAALGIQQQDRHRVDLEQRLRPLEQGRQQVVEAQMRKRRIGHKLQPPQPWASHSSVSLVKAWTTRSGDCRSSRRLSISFSVPTTPRAGRRW
jgi:hypothetical protein